MTPSTVTPVKTDCTWFHKARLISCILQEENKKGKKRLFFLRECCPAINPTIMKRSKLNGHLPLEVALCSTAVARSDQLPQTPPLPTKKEKEKGKKKHSANPKCKTWRPNSITTEISLHARNQVRKKKKFKSLQKSEHQKLHKHISEGGLLLNHICWLYYLPLWIACCI